MILLAIVTGCLTNGVERCFCKYENRKERSLNLALASIPILAGLLLFACSGDEKSDSLSAGSETPTATGMPAAAASTSEPPGTAAPTVEAAPGATTAPAAVAAPTRVPPTAVPSVPLTPVSNPSGVCIEAWTPGEVIENLLIGPCGDIGIDVRAPGVIIRNVTIFSAGTSLRVYEASNVVIEGSTLRDPTNRGGDGYVQQISVDQSSNVTIRGNTLLCASTSACRQEDAIGIYRSSGVIVEGNSISGGNSDSGCGIMADAGARRVTIRGNTVRNQANCAIGVANGTDHLVEGNNVAIYGNVGIYVWNQYGGQCARITIRNNVVSGSNPWWDGDNCSQVDVTGNSFTKD